MTQYKLIVDCTTGKQEYIALTPAEIAENDQRAAKYAEEKAKSEAEAQALAALKESAKAKLTSGEPLTEEEAAAIVI
jgi:uncharacterized coiled-coil DUF342 family protein